MALLLPMVAQSAPPSGVPTPSLMPELAAEWDAVVSRDAVAGAFRSNLDTLDAPASPAFPARAIRSASRPSGPVASHVTGGRMPLAEIAALEFAEASAFKANLTGATQIALTPTVSVTPLVLNLTASATSAPTQNQFQIGSLGGTVNWTAAVSLLNGNGGLSVTPTAGTVSAAQGSTVTLGVNYGALGGPGLYQALLTVTDKDTGYAAVTPIAVVLNATQSWLQLSQSSFVFSVVDGGTAPAPQSLNIINGGQGNMAWSIDTTGFPNWLTVSPATGTAVGGVGGLFSTSASAATFSINNTNALALAPGAYQVLVPVLAPGVSNGLQFASVTLQRLPASAPAVPALSSNGFIFIATQGGSPPPTQTLNFGNVGGGGTLRVTYTIETLSGGNWLSLAGIPLLGQGFPVAVNQGTLAAGTYRAHIHGSFTASSGPPVPDQDADVLLVVVPSGRVAAGLREGESHPAVDNCTPQSLEMVANSIGNGAAVATSFPKVLVVTVVDSCGTNVPDATVVASVENSQIFLQSLGNGVYSGNWVPQQTGATQLTFTALRPGLTQAKLSFNISNSASAAGVQLPVLFPDGVVDAAGFTPRRPLAPGSIVSLFGSRLAPQDAVASKIPLDKNLAGVSVRIGNQDIPLYAVHEGQVNAQIPFDVSPGATVSVAINSNGRLTAPQNYLVGAAQPGIFVVLDGKSRPVTADNPALVGDTLQIYSNGLGTTNPPVPTGDQAPGFTTVTNPVKVTIGGVEMPVVYQGLVPGLVGLYQVNVALDATTPTGDDIPVVIIQNGISSNPNLPVSIPVRKP